MDGWNTVIPGSTNIAIAGKMGRNGFFVDVFLIGKVGSPSSQRSLCLPEGPVSLWDSAHFPYLDFFWLKSQEYWEGPGAH